MTIAAKLALGAAAAVGAGYAALLLWFKGNEDRLLFQPDTSKLAPPPAELHLRSHDVRFISEPGVTLVARVISPAQEQGSAWILYLHGASANIGAAGYNEAWARFIDLGLGVFAVDYRGYGESTGTPSEAGLYRDAEAAYRHLRHELGVPPELIFIYGYSLGSAVAIDLAARVEAAGLMVEGALLSVPTRAAELYPYVPVRWLARNRFASIEKIAAVAMPKLFLHARADEAIPFAHGQRLYDLAQPPKRIQAVAGGHTTAFKEDPAFFAAVLAFVREARTMTSASVGQTKP